MDTVVTLTKQGNAGDILAMRFPAFIGRPMMERGYTHARLAITNDGILIVPFVGTVKDTHRKPNAELPEWT